MNGHAICPFCDSQVMYGGVEFGGSLLHDDCYATLQRDEESVVIESIPLLEKYEDGKRD